MMRLWLCGLIGLLMWATCLANPFDVLVVDEVTGQPITAYTMRVYSPEGQWRGGLTDYPQWTARPDQLPGRLRVLAKGYLPGTSELLTADGPRDVLIELVPQDRIEGVVIDRDGRPVDGAQVSLVQQGQPAVIKDGRAVGVADELSISTDEKGWFSLPLKGDDWALLATHESGAAIYLATELPEEVKLTILPWASCEGLFHEHGKPVAGRPVAAEVLFYNMKDYISIAPAVTGEDGRWRVGHLLAKAGALEEIWYNVGRELRPAPNLIVAQRYEAYVNAGKKLKIDMIRKGVDVIGRIVIPPQRASEVEWRESMIGLRVDLPSVALPPEYEGFTREQQAAWWAEYEQSEAGKARKASKAILASHPQRYQQALLSEDGAFRFTDVPPGRFQFNAYIQPRVPQGVNPLSVHPIAEITKTVDVPPEAEGVEDGVSDMGDIQP